MISYSVSELITHLLTFTPTIMLLTEITTRKQLTNFLKCSREFLEKMEAGNYVVFENYSIDLLKEDILIKRFNIPKRNLKLGFRVIHKPHTNNLEFCLKLLNSELRKIYVPNESVQGFVPKRNIRSNAFLHLGKKHLLSFDIKNFFETINREQIEFSLTKLGVNPSISKSLSHVVTLNGYLVQGFSTSPTLANIVIDELDIKIVEHIGNGVVYSRYADDLYFSSNSPLPNVDEIESIINNSGFDLNHEKTKIMPRGKGQFVTGLSVFDKAYPRIPKKIKRNIRLEIHYIEKNGYRKHILSKFNIDEGSVDKDELEGFIEFHRFKITQKLLGWLRFINSIEPAYAQKYTAKIAAVDIGS